MKKHLFISSVVIILLSTNIFAQAWPSSDATRPSFSGFGLSMEDEGETIFSEGETNSSQSFAGDYIKSADDGFGEGELEDPGYKTPIVESILGLFGLGAVYVWRLFRKKKDE